MKKSTKDLIAYSKNSLIFRLFSWILPGDFKKSLLETNNEDIIKTKVEKMESTAPIRLSLFKGLREYLKELRLEKTLSYGLFSWESKEVKRDEWAYAQGKLAPKGVLLPDGTKLRRKDHPGMTHSFIIIDGRILAIAGKEKVNHLGEGASARAKMGEDEDGGVWAIKIRDSRKNSNSGEDRLIPDSPKEEEKIVVDRSNGLKSTQRKSSNGNPGKPEVSNIPTKTGVFWGFEANKHYLATAYRGKTLEKYLKENRNLTKAQRYDLAIKITELVNNLHAGVGSKKKNKYTHRGLSHENITIDDLGDPHLIDFGSSSNAQSLSKSKFEYYCRQDIGYLADIFQAWLFPEYRTEYKSSLYKLFNETGSNYASDLEYVDRFQGSEFLNKLKELKSQEYPVDSVPQHKKIH